MVMTLKEIIQSISPRERWIILWVAIAICIITAVPFIYGQLNAPADSLYTPNFHRTTGDTYVYMSMIEEARQGALTFHNLFTSEAHPPVLLNPLWWTLGLIARFFTLDSGWWMQIARAALIFVTVPAIYLTIALFIKKRATRLLSLVLAVTVSGLGYLYYRLVDPSIIPNIFTINFYSTPTDVWLAEAYPQLMFLASPHFQLSLICLLFTFIFFYLGMTNGPKRYLVYSGLFNLALAIFHPYETVFILFVTLPFTAVLMFWPGTSWRDSGKYLAKFALTASITLPGLLYQAYIFMGQPVFKSWAWQSMTISPDYRFYLWGFGIFVPLGVLGAIVLFRRLNTLWAFLLVWVIITLPLLYSPFPFNRRFIEGIFVPLGILAAVAIVALYEKISADPPWKRRCYLLVMATILLVAIVPTNSYNWWSFLEVQRVYQVVPFYLPRDEQAAMDWIKRNTAPGAVILSSHIAGFLIPAFTARPVYIGHDLQTAYFSQKKPLVDWFFQSDASDADQKEDFLWLNNISYLYYGPNERGGGTFNPETKSYLEKVFDRGRVTIYKVTP